MFRNRQDAARQLVDALRPMKFKNPLVLAISRGGMVIGALIAEQLGMELDVLLCRKLRSSITGLPVGAVSESGILSIDRMAAGMDTVTAESIIEERSRQLSEIARERSEFRSVRSPATIADRSLLVTDDGLISGATMTAALDGIRRGAATELVVVLPVANRERLPGIRRRCDRLICLVETQHVQSLAECYGDFPPVPSECAAEMLKKVVPGGADIREH